MSICRPAHEVDELGESKLDYTFFVPHGIDDKLLGLGEYDADKFVSHIQLAQARYCDADLQRNTRGLLLSKVLEGCVKHIVVLAEELDNVGVGTDHLPELSARGFLRIG